jgi:2-polyprenyl-3-methyl-5-hydroxy-6-metoxy-1,4-benzoquinol methylase
MTAKKVTDALNIDLAAIAANVRQVQPGMWTVEQHQDFEFLANDDSDWTAIEQDSFWYRHRASAFTTFLKHCPPNGPVFELGCGSGVNALAMQDAGYPVVGIEPTDYFANLAYQKELRNVVLSTVEECGFESEAIANACMFDVLEHILNDAEYLRHLRSLMPTGGPPIHCSPCVAMVVVGRGRRGESPPTLLGRRT